MCGRFAFYSPAEATAALFGASVHTRIVPRYNIAPSQEIAVVRNGESGEGREFALLRWGLVPFWAKDPSIGNRMINARAETVRITRRSFLIAGAGVAGSLVIGVPVTVSRR